jgi:hypothetical protein
MDDTPPKKPENPLEEKSLEKSPSKETGDLKETAVPVIPPEILRNIPESDRHRIESFLSMAMSFGPSPNPLHQKVTPEHIGLMIQAQTEETKMDHAERRQTRWMLLSGFVFASILTATILIILSAWGKTDTLNELIKSGFIGLGGFGGGYGVAHLRNQKDQ